MEKREQESQMEGSTEVSTEIEEVDPNTVYVSRDEEGKMQVNSKIEWKIVKDAAGEESYEEILKNNEDVPEKDYKHMKMDSIEEMIPNWYIIRESKMCWKYGWQSYGNQPDKIARKTHVETYLIEISLMLKRVEKHIEENEDEKEKEKFYKKWYPKIVRTRKTLMNLYKKFDKKGCVEFLRENPIVGKYGKKVYESKPKKN